MKKYSFKKILALILMGTFLFVFIPVGITKASNSTTPGWKKDTKPITFDWYMHYSWFSTKWGGNVVSDYITKKTGVKINFIAPAGNENEKLNVMIASNTLPDFITLGWWEAGIKKMIEGKLVYALDELAKKYDPYFFTVAKKQVLGWYTQPDGHVYGYPDFPVTPDDLKKKDVRITSNQTFLVRKDMYEALGKPDMRKPDTFLKALSDAKKKFPKVNGQPLIPIEFHEFTDSGCYSLESYLQNFLAIPREVNGKLYDTTTHPEYVRWLKTFNKAYRMGLIAKDVFIDKRTQMEEKIAQGRYFSMLYQRSDFKDAQRALYEKNPNMIYIAVDGPANSKLEKPKLAPSAGIAGWNLNLISKKCKNPERAIKFLTYLISPEGQRDQYLGPKGVTWDIINGKEQFKPEIKKLLEKDKDTCDKKYAIAGVYWLLYDSAINSKWELPEPAYLKQMADWTVGKVVSYDQYNDIDPLPNTKEGVIATKVGQKWGQVLPKLIMAKSDQEFDKILNDFQKYKRDIGYDKVLAYRQKKLEENKKKLGLK